MISIPVLTLLVIYLLYQRRNKHRFGAVSFLIVTYLIMGISSLLCELFPILFIDTTIRVEPMIFLSGCFLVIFLGFWNFTDSKFNGILIENTVLYRWLGNILIIGGILAIAFFFPFAIDGLKGDISSNRFDMMQNGPSVAKFGIFNSIFSLFANMSILAQVLGFLCLIPVDGNRRVGRAVLLLVSSLSYVVYVLAYVGRDGVIYWTMSFLFCFLMFRGFLGQANLKKLKRAFAITLFLIFIPFVMISVSRFSTSAAGTSLSLISYSGQQIRNFNDHYQIKAPLQDGRVNFPVFVDFLEKVGLKGMSTYDQEQYYSYFTDSDVTPYVFTTFIGMFMMDFGKIGVLVILSLMALILWVSTRRLVFTGIINFSNLILFVLLYQIIHWGVFYFRQYSANFYFIGMLLIVAIFKWFGMSYGAWPKRLLVKE
jgi:oligosaccharide repeat unit polymerase